MPFPLTSTVLVNQDAQGGTQNGPLTAQLSSGGYVVVWQDTVPGGTQDVLYAIYDAAGARTSTGMVPAGATTASNESLFDVIALPGGGFTVAWLSSTPANFGSPANVTRGGKSASCAIQNSRSRL